MFINGKGKQGFPLSPDINFNRSAVSLRLYGKISIHNVVKFTCKDKPQLFFTFEKKLGRVPNSGASY